MFSSKNPYQQIHRISLASVRFLFFLELDTLCHERKPNELREALLGRKLSTHELVDRFVVLLERIFCFLKGMENLFLKNDVIADTTGRKRLVMLKRTVPTPINSMAESTQSISIYGGAKPREENWRPEEDK